MKKAPKRNRAQRPALPRPITSDTTMMYLVHEGVPNSVIADSSANPIHQKNGLFLTPPEIREKGVVLCSSCGAYHSDIKILKTCKYCGEQIVVVKTNYSA